MTHNKENSLLFVNILPETIGIDEGAVQVIDVKWWHPGLSWFITVDCQLMLKTEFPLNKLILTT